MYITVSKFLAMISHFEGVKKKCNHLCVLKKSKNISLLEKKVTIFTLFGMKSHFLE